MKSILLVFWLLFVSSLFGQMPVYYQGIDFSEPVATVEANLQSLITTTHNPLTYSQTYGWLKWADEDPNNTSNVILMYNGQSISKLNTIGGGNTTNPEDWNREHIYPQSMIVTPADADLHHLRACDGDINNNRGNLPFVNGSGSYGTASGGWYPGDEWKGDVARMIMYVHLRYDEPWTDVGSLSLFLQWNVDDPVSDFEKQRNNIIYGAQGNRNPFIDQPYLATFLYGGPDAEDTWGWPNLIDEKILEQVSIYPNPTTESKIVTFSDVSTSLDVVIFYDLSGKQMYAVRDPFIVGNKFTIDVDFPSGVYLVKMIADQVQLTKKLVVN